MRSPTIRFRIDFSGRCSVGIGKIQLLEAIADGGSLSQAARTLKMSYRRAWLLLQDMNASFDEPVASASVGGRGGGGVALTALGQRLVEDYRSLESGILELAAARLRRVAGHASADSAVAAGAGSAIRRKLVAHGGGTRVRGGG